MFTASINGIDSLLRYLYRHPCNYRKARTAMTSSSPVFEYDKKKQISVLGMNNTDTNARSGWDAQAVPASLY